jgi:hypothetical protein
MAGAAIYVVFDNDGEVIGATLDKGMAKAHVDSHPGHRQKKVPRLTECSAATHRNKKNEVTPALVQLAIRAKIGGVSLSTFAKSRGVKYVTLRDAVNEEWGFTKPWPKGAR